MSPDDNTNTLTDNDRPRNAINDTLIYSHEHIGFWRQNERGYTLDLDQAGVFTAQRAQEIVQNATPGDEFALKVLSSGGKREVFDRVLMTGIRALGLDRSSMTGSVGTADQARQQSSR